MNVGRNHFDNPILIGDGYLCPTGGVYLILCRRNGKKLEPVYVSEVGGLRRKIGPQHRMLQEVQRNYKHPLVASHPLPMCTKKQRERRAQGIRSFLSLGNS